MLEIIQNTHEKLPLTTKNRLKFIAKTLDPKKIELVLVNDDDMRALNFDARGKNSVTDVLSFPTFEMPRFLGSVVICVDEATRAAQKFAHTLCDELCLLLIHGILHCQGFDHERDNGEHRRAEAEWISHFLLPKSLISRNFS